MAEQYNPQNIANVPVFSFSLANINPAEASILFSQQKKSEKRRPGLITNIRKQTVSQLLEVFRPNAEINQQIFNVKKKLVVTAIEAMYESKAAIKNYHQGTPLTQNPQSLHNQEKKFQRSRYLYYTPIKSYNSQSRDSTQTTKRSLSQSKLNYGRNEQKFDENEISKLRKRAGLLK